MSRARDFADLAGSADAGGLTGRNLVIGGCMRVAQRGTSAVTSSGGYPVDRFSASYNVTSGAFSSVQSSVTPDNFVSSLKWETTTAASAGTNEVCTFGTKIEGYDINQLNWGTSAARKCVVSFQVRSSLTGTYSFSIRNSDASRSYIAEYTISSADTWEQKEIVIPGPTDGTWNSTNGIGMILNWDLGSGSGRQGTAGSWLSGTNDFASTNQVNFANTASAAFYITGIQLEVGEQATPFEHRSFGDELARCQRYAYSIQATGNPLGLSGATISGGSRSFFGFGNAHNSSNPVTWLNMPVPMRVVPSLTVSDNTHFDFDRGWASLASSTSTQIQTLRSSSKAIAVICNVGSGLSNGEAGSLSSNNSAAYMIFDAEL